MSISTLSRYLIKIYLEKFFLIFIVISSALTLSNIFDLLNKLGSTDLKAVIFLQLIFLKLPYLFSELLPLTCMLAMFLTHYILGKQNELAIICGSGISIFALITPIVTTTFVLGVFVITLLNPISTHMLAKYESMEAKLVKRKSTNLVLSNVGIIISEHYQKERRIYMVKTLSVIEKKMIQITVLFADENNTFLHRIDANDAILDEGRIFLKNIKIFNQKGERENHEEYIMPTSLNIANFVEGVTDPSHLNFWQLPEAINNLKQAGLPVIKHQLYYYKILFRPIIMMAYIFLAACFISKDTRSQSAFRAMILGIFIGFAIYLIMQIITNILVYSGISTIISVVVPTLIIILLSNFIILHLRMD